MNQPADLGQDDEWWTNRQIRAYLASIGITIARTTWNNWITRGKAPTADPQGRIGAYPRWRASVIREHFRPGRS